MVPPAVGWLARATLRILQPRQRGRGAAAPPPDIEQPVVGLAMLGGGQQVGIVLLRFGLRNGPKPVAQ